MSRRLHRTKNSRQKAPKHTKSNLKKPKTIRRNKNDIARAEHTNTIHHRRPLSLDGSTDKSNISYLTEEIHRAWTILVGNMNAEQITNFFNIIIKPKQQTFICMFINGKRCLKSGLPGTEDPEKRAYALQILFKGYKNIKEKMTYVNNVLLDPAYHIYIRD